MIEQEVHGLLYHPSVGHVPFSNTKSYHIDILRLNTSTYAITDIINLMAKKIQYQQIIISALIWFTIWVITQGLFISGILTQLPGELNLKNAIATSWVLLITIICLYAMPVYRKNLLPKSKLVWLYLIPLGLLLLLPAHYQLVLNLPVYIFMILVTVFWQDYLTFGLFQTYLEKRLHLNTAAILTALLFLVGHVVFYINDLFNIQFVIIAIAGFLFSFSRRYFKNIYIANILHLCFLLLIV
jgi:Type II CAAX prenyl endopeptidase Rce1-like